MQGEVCQIGGNGAGQGGLAPTNVQVCAQFLWETSARVLIDFTPGAGMMAKTALMMGIKTVAVCHNAAHVKTLQGILKNYIRANMGSNAHLAVPDKADRLNAAKPARLGVWETQTQGQKRPADDKNCPSAKRAAMATTWESMLSAMTGETPSAKASPTKPPPPMLPPTPTPPPTTAPSTPARVAAKEEQPTSADAAVVVNGPTANLSTLLDQWA